MIRYTHDFACALRHQKDAERFYRTLGKRLGRFGLELSAEKVRAMRFRSIIDQAMPASTF